MSFHKIIRMLEHPRRADQSAMCAINRHLRLITDDSYTCGNEGGELDDGYDYQYC